MEEQDVNYMTYKGILYLKATDVAQLLETTEFNKKEVAQQLKEQIEARA